MRGVQRGLTLVELLISMVVLGVVLAVVVDLFVSSLATSADLQGRNDLLQETQVAQQLVAGRVREAWYVYPPGASFNLASSGYSTRNPAGGYAWVVGRDPVLALILPPRSAGACTASSTDACYTFYAYFPVRRGEITGAALGANNPGRDAVNDGRVWVLMQYAAHFVALGSAAPSVYPNPPVPPAGNTALILADYVQPTGSAPAYTMFESVTRSAPGSTPPARWGVPVGAAFTWVDRVEFKVRAQRQAGGRTVRLPGGSEPLTLALYPRNLGR